MKTRIKIDDFLSFIYWIKMSYLVEGKKFKHEGLVQQAETYRLTGTPLDTRIHPIDSLMVDSFPIYLKLKESQEIVKEYLETNEMPSFLDKNIMLNETKKFFDTFEDLLENYKYDEPEIRGIQMVHLQKRMKEYAIVEDYENAAIIRDRIKEI